MLQQKLFNSERKFYEYHILDSSKNKVGMAQLRLTPSKSSEMPEGFESHVYYEVDPEHRGKGYATEALKELLKEAEQHGISPVVATVNSDNLASIKVIEKCGGKLEVRGVTSNKQPVLKYRISLL
jgi:predicted acetyltransferase